MLSHQFMELAHIYIAESHHETKRGEFYAMYRNLSKNTYGLTEMEYWMIFCREWGISGFTICGCCLRKMCHRDIAWHRCQGSRGGDEKIVLNRFKVILRSLSLTRRSVMTTILILKGTLGRDLAIMIGKIVYETRYNFPLWYQSNQIPPRRKQKKGRNKRLKDPKDFRWIP